MVMIEMLPMINVNPHDVDDDVPITKKTQQQLDGFPSAISRRVRRNYLSMIAVAYALTLSCDGTGLWLSSSRILSCGNNSSLLFLSENATKTVTSTSAGTKNYSGIIEESDYDYSSNNNITTTTAIDDDDLFRQSLDKKCMTYKWRRIHLLSLIKLTICTIMLIVLFLNLQGSDPGYLTIDVMSRFDASTSEETSASDDSRRTNNTDKMDCDTKTMVDDDIERQSFLEPLPQSPLPTKDVTLLPPSFHQTNTILSSQSTTVTRLYPHARRKSCRTCHHSPPLRSHHCNVCNTCIATFDHHCKFLNTCIGERNHFRFWTFCALNVLCFHLALDIVKSSSHRSRTMTTTDTNDLGLLVGMVIHFIARTYMYPLFASVLLIWIIHTLLVLGNVTTFELTKGSEHIDYLYGTGMLDFPFGQGLCSNLRTFIMRDDMAVWFVRHCSKVGSMSNDTIINETSEWVPMVWKLPISIDRESEDWWNHPWQNKYWSCC